MTGDTIVIKVDYVRECETCLSYDTREQSFSDKMGMISNDLRAVTEPEQKRLRR